MSMSARFVWHELQTRDRAKAFTFYGQLLGWEIKEIPEPRSDDPRGDDSRGDDPHAICLLDGRNIAGVTTSKAPAHVPAYWLPYLAVEDVDAKANEAKLLGARVIREPVDISGIGRAAVVLDPRGAVFALRAGHAPDVEPAAPPEGDFCWDELLTDDPEVSATFYAKLFGCSVEPVDMGPIGVYRILRVGDREIAGVMKHPEKVHPHWLPYLAVRDVDAVTRRALELGASLYVPARDIPGVGRFSGIDDPTGAGVCLFRGPLGGRPDRGAP